MEDVTPTLLASVKKTYQAGLKNNKTLDNVTEKIKNETASYDDGYNYALEIGAIVSKAFRENLTAETLPNGILYYNIATRVIEPILKEAYERTAGIMADIQEIINEKAGVKLGTVKPEISENRVEGIINSISGKTLLEVEQ